MNLLKEVIKYITEVQPKKKSVVPPGLFAGSFGKYYRDKELQQYAGKVTGGRWVPASAEADKPTAAATKPAPKKPGAPAPKPTVKVSVGEPSSDAMQSVTSMPGGRGVLDAIKGVTEVGSAGAGTPESRAAEASVVLIGNDLLQSRSSFSGTMDEFLEANNDKINSMIDQLMNLPGSKLKKDWMRAVKNQVVATLSQTEKQYGRIDALAWDNKEGRQSMGLPAKKDGKDRSDLYLKLEDGRVVGVSLKKTGNVFLANQGYTKIMNEISAFTSSATAKEKIKGLQSLHKQTTKELIKDLVEYAKANSKSLNKKLSKITRDNIPEVDSSKYDKYFTTTGNIKPELVDKMATGSKLSSDEFKLFLKSMTGLGKAGDADIQQKIEALRSVDKQVTQKLLSLMDSDSDIKRATTEYLLDALDIPQMLGDSPFEGISQAVTVYGEGNVDANKNNTPMYVNGDTLRSTFNIEPNVDTESAMAQLRERFIIDTEADNKMGFIRLRISNPTPPPNYYYPTIASVAVRARGLGTAAAFELYQQNAWTFTLANKSPNPETWSPSQRKKHKEDTIRFLTRQASNPVLTDEQLAEIEKDIKFYEGIK